MVIRRAILWAISSILVLIEFGYACQQPGGKAHVPRLTTEDVVRPPSDKDDVASWGVYYPYAASYATVIDAGSLRIEMLDLRTPNPSSKQLTAIWTASFDGLLGSDPASLLQRIEKGIDQAFAQSPYL